MRGKNYNPGSRRIVGGGSLGIFLIILTLAIALIFVLLLYMPLTDTENNAGVMGVGQTTQWNKIVGISYAEREIGVGSEKDKIYLTVTYDNGEKEDVALSQMVCAGLDVTSSGTQNVSLSYGGFEQTIPITVRDVDCVLTYSASDGGRINGEQKQTIVSGQDGSTVEAVPETGYSFVEWSDGYPYPIRKDRNVNETREFKAIFEKTQFVVFFYYDDGTVAREETVLYGEAAVDVPKLSSDPRMSVYGKTFIGWSVSEEDYKRVVRNMNIYPQYEKTATDVEMEVATDQYGNHMGETDINDYGYYAHDAIASITATSFSSREFDCWEVYAFRTPDSQEAEWLTLPKKVQAGSASLICYIGDNRETCEFKSNSTGNAGTQYTITFRPNEYMDVIKLRVDFVYSNSTVTFINYQNSVKNNQEYVVADIPYTRQIRDEESDKVVYSYSPTLGEILAERYWNAGGTAITGEGDAPYVTTDIGGKLVLTANRYSETVRGDDDSLLALEKAGIATLVPADVYGLTFLGWYDKLDSEQKLITENKVFREPTSLIAKWDKLIYTLVFDYNDADNGADSASITVIYQNTIGSGGGVPSAQPYREGYNFVGWEDRLTHELVDDTTQITVRDEYINEESFTKRQTLEFIPRWEIKQHVLSVQSSGSGTVVLRSTSPMGVKEETVVSGEFILYETYDYELVFRADVGYYVSDCTWQYGDEIPVKWTDGADASAPLPHSDVDNHFTVVFSPKKYTATVYNGDAVYRGYIEVIGSSEGESRFGLGSEESDSFIFHHGDTILLNVRSLNDAFEISDIRVTGTVGGSVRNYEAVTDGLAGSKTMEQDVLLENCTSDIDVYVSYSGVSYAVDVAQPTNGSVGTTVLNGSESDYSLAPAHRNYAPDEDIHYLIKADDGYYLSDIHLSGVQYDVYSAYSGNVVFYDWEVNGEYYGVGLKYIDGVYYYSYGMASYEGTNYLYCRRADDGEEAIFIVYDVLNERYEMLGSTGANNAAIPAAYYERIGNYLLTQLKVEEKGIGNATQAKDRRVTAVKLMITPTSNVNIKITMTEIEYSVSYEKSSLATVTLSSETAAPGDSVSVTVSTLNGYTLVGYYLNDAEEMTPVTLGRQGQTFMTDFDDIREDLSLRFAYRLITYEATFQASLRNCVTVEKEDSDESALLANTYTFGSLEYGRKASFRISVTESGKRITSFKVDGVDYPVLHNMTSYLYVCDSVKSSLTVVIGCGNLEEDEVTDFGFDVQFNLSGKNAFGSVNYVSSGRKAVLSLLAENGYDISEVVVRNNINNNRINLSFAGATDTFTLTDGTGTVTSSDVSYVAMAQQLYRKAFALTLPEESFSVPGEAPIVTVEVTTTADSYPISVADTENGTVSVSPTAPYGSSVGIIVSASSNYYIDSLTVNGVSVPFGTANWTQMTRDNESGLYTRGTYNYIVTGATTVRAVFKRFTYTVKIDGTSVGGVTTLSVTNAGDMNGALTDGKAPYGSKIIIGMEANRGYHIKSVYVNGLDSGYTPYSSTENMVANDTFVYAGDDGLTGLTKNISVRVYYEINKYSFNYTIVNASKNFAGANGSGTLTVADSYRADGRNKYTGIAYGDNFAVIVTPNVSSGYYLYSMSITYKGENDDESVTKVRTCDDLDGIVSRTGGTIWFNRFWFSEAAGNAIGVTADITDITVTFKREVYTLSFDQKTIGGGLTASFINPTSTSSDYIVVQGRIAYCKEGGVWRPYTESQVPTLYYYSYDSVTGRGKFMTRAGNAYTETLISIRYKNGRSGEVVFADDDYIYEMSFEFGLRCVITVKPDTGYDRIDFNVNGENKMENVGGDNRFTFTFSRAVSVDVSYQVQSFYVELKTTIYKDRINNSRVTADSGESNNYVEILLRVYDENGDETTTYIKDARDLNIVKKFDYGTRLRFDIISKFSDKGVYLYNLTRSIFNEEGVVINAEMLEISGDPMGTVTYGPFIVTEKLTLNAIFEVISYKITTEVEYDETLNNESRNVVSKDSDESKSSWSVLWGGVTAVNLNIDQGFMLDKIVITTDDGDYRLSENDPGRDTDDYYYVLGESSETSRTQYVLHLNLIKSDISVKVYLQRRSYNVFYKVNDFELIESMTTYYNEYTDVYPNRTVLGADTVTGATWQLAARYYDELRAVVTPIDGYEITAERINIYRAVFNTRRQEWERETQPLVSLNFSVVTGSTKQFMFHASSSFATLFITGDTMIEIELVIKRYSLETNIVRVDAIKDTSDSKNSTEVSLTVHVSPTDSSLISVNGVAQRKQVMGKSVNYNQAVTQHGASIEYEFITPEGYQLSDLTVNGFSPSDEIVRDNITIIASKYDAEPSRYSYKILITVNTKIVNGAVGFYKTSDRLIVVDMEIRPVNYEIFVVINRSLKDFETLSGRNGVTDNQTLTVYSRSSVDHFDDVNIEPLLMEGYRIVNTQVYVGKVGGVAYLTSSDIAGFAGQTQITAIKTLKFNYTNLSVADATKDKTAVYFFFTTDIIYYNVKVDANAYYSDAGTLVQETLYRHSDAGKLVCNVTNRVRPSEGGTVNLHNDTDLSVNSVERLDKSYPYFSNVTITATEKAGFALFCVYEYVYNTAKRIYEWVAIADNVNELSYVSKTNGSLTTHTLTFTVNGRGDRSFKFEFKQRTTVTVNIPNVFKYVAGSVNSYLGYTNLKAYESDDEYRDGAYLDAINTDSGIRATTRYIYSVFVGNYFTVNLEDIYRQGARVNFSVYNADLREIAVGSGEASGCIDDSQCYVNDVFNLDKFKVLYNDRVRDVSVPQAVYGGDNNGVRYQIKGNEVFYVYDDDVYGRVSATKDTKDAVSAANVATTVGGDVRYNDSTSEARNNVIYEDTKNQTTKEGNVLTIVCEARENYSFYRLLFRQVNRSESVRQGYVVFGNTDISSWQQIVYTSASDNNTRNVKTFNERIKDSNSYALLNFREENGKYIFTLWMNGDVEIMAEYYRTYTVTYDVYMSDVLISDPSLSFGSIGTEDGTDIVFTTGGKGPFEKAKQNGTQVKISYGSDFTLTVTPPVGNYVFVGWYINDTNLYGDKLNRLMPTSDYYTWHFIADYNNMSTLVPTLEDGRLSSEEVTDIVIYARFEPVIDVQIINEKFYAYDYHFNSWEMGTVEALYYNYSRAQDEITGVPAKAHSRQIVDETGKTIAAAQLAIYNSGAGDYADLWSELYASPVVNGYGENLYTYKVYSDVHEFSVLLDNITNEDYVHNSWVTSSIELHMNNMASDVGFTSWQYFNWNTGEWTVIPYSYVDPTAGLSADGSQYTINAYSTDYVFSLEALYSGIMPYAISENNASNLNASSPTDYRPLLIRPNVYKFFTVELSQYAFSDNFGGGLSKIDVRRLEDVARPTIDSYTVSDADYSYRNLTNEDLLSGTYEYGTILDLLYNGADSGKEIYNDSKAIRFRFIGWYIQIGGTTYLLQGSDNVTADPFRYQLICAEAASNTTIRLLSYYVRQYKQSFSSYGISGDDPESATYTTSASMRSGKAAPKAHVEAGATQTPISIPVVSMANNCIVYTGKNANTTSKNMYYQVSSTVQSISTGLCAQLSTNGSPYTGETGWAFELYMDAGLNYELIVDKNTSLVTSNVIKNSSNYSTNTAYNYFNTEFDTLYRLREDGEITQDFSSFYNTGKGTYYREYDNRQVTSYYLTNRALNSLGANDSQGYYLAGNGEPDDFMTAKGKYYIKEGSVFTLVDPSSAYDPDETYYVRIDHLLTGWENGAKTYRSSSAHKVDVQYVSTATLIFYNMIYKSGITIENAAMVNALTGGTKSALTVWDCDTIYGDWSYDDWISTKGVLPNTANANVGRCNGEVVIRVTLFNMQSNGYAGFVSYALNGMRNGYGIPGKKDVTDRSNVGLFSPSYYGYGRWVEYDLNDFYDDSTVIDNTRVFGYGGFLTNAQAKNVGATNTVKVGRHDPTPDCYNNAYCGHGIYSPLAADPYIYAYKIFIRNINDNNKYSDNTQLSFVDIFWRYNGYTCKNDNGEQCAFVIETSTTGGINGIGANGVINLSTSGATGISWNALANSTPQGVRSFIWEPLCSSTEADNDGIKGFDGAINFKSGATDNSGVKVFGIAVGSEASPSGAYYGLFGKVVGGTVCNLQMTNGYYEVGGQTYVGLVCGYAADATFHDICFFMPTETNAYKGSETFTFGGSASQANIFLFGASYAGALFGYGVRCSCQRIRINNFNTGRSGAYIEVSATTYAGALIGAIEGGRIEDVKVNGNTWLVVNASPYQNATEGSGGLIGYAGARFTVKSNNVQHDSTLNELTVLNITMNGSPSIIVGKDTSSVAGGIFGVVGPATTVYGINMTTGTNIEYKLDAFGHSATSNVVMLTAVPKSVSTSSIKAVSSYGFAGEIAGLNYGTIDGKYETAGGNTVSSSLNGYVFANAGTAGGLVGGNFGTVTNFTLGSGFRLYAWEPSATTNSYNYGGLVGYNYGAGKGSTKYVANGVAGTIDIMYSGLINDCKLTGADSSNGNTIGNNVYGYATVYVFRRREINGNKATYDGTFRSNKAFYTNSPVTESETYSGSGVASEQFSTVSNKDNYYLNQNYMRMGGICGTSSGRIYNCVVNNVRLASSQWRYSYAASSSVGNYGWAIYAGLVCGYLDPASNSINGWDSYSTYVRTLTAQQLMEMSALNTCRIQSCNVIGGTVNINTNIWMDNVWNSSGPQEGGADDQSIAMGISLGGIVGGTSTNASSDYAVNTCKVENTKFYAYSFAYGSTSSSGSATSKDNGWKRWEDSETYWENPIKKVTYTNYHSICLRPFAIIEIKANNIAAGLYPQMAGSSPYDAGRSNYCYSSGVKLWATPASQVEGTYQKLGSASAANWPFKDSGGSGGIGGAWVRYVKYQGGKKGRIQNEVSSSVVDTMTSFPKNDLMNSAIDDQNTASSSKLMYGFYNGHVIRTDPNTGCVMYTNNDMYYAYSVEADGSGEWRVTEDAPSAPNSSMYVE